MPQTFQDPSFFLFISVVSLRPTIERCSSSVSLTIDIRFMTDLLRKYRGSVVIMVGRGGAEPHYVHK